MAKVVSVHGAGAFGLYGRQRPQEFHHIGVRLRRVIALPGSPWLYWWRQCKSICVGLCLFALVFFFGVIAWHLALPARVDLSPASSPTMRMDALAHRVAWLRQQLVVQKQDLAELERRVTQPNRALPLSVQPSDEQLQQARNEYWLLRQELLLLGGRE
ncbi:hypothetical protein [Ferrimonas pelagia]